MYVHIYNTESVLYIFMYIVPMQINEVNFHFTNTVTLLLSFASSCLFAFFFFILHLTNFSLSCVSPSLPSLWRRFSSKPLPHSSTFYMALVRSTYPEGLQPSEFRWRIFPPLYSPSFYTNGACGQGVIEEDFFSFHCTLVCSQDMFKKKKKGQLPPLRSGNSSLSNRNWGI